MALEIREMSFCPRGTGQSTNNYRPLTVISTKNCRREFERKVPPINKMENKERVIRTNGRKGQNKIFLEEVLIYILREPGKFERDGREMTRKEFWKKRGYSVRFKCPVDRARGGEDGLGEASASKGWNKRDLLTGSALKKGERSCDERQRVQSGEKECKALEAEPRGGQR